MQDIIHGAFETNPEPSSMILVIGKSSAGKSTLIGACTSEDYANKHPTGSNVSSKSGDYDLPGYNASSRLCFFQEEPSFLENPHVSYERFVRFAKFLLSDEGEHVTGIVYVLNHQQESVAQQPAANSTYPLAFKSHLEFARSWIGSCPGSTILTINRLPPEGIDPRLRAAWDGTLSQQSLGIKEDDPDDVISTVITAREHKLQLWNEIYGKEKKQLRKTQLGKLYTEQLNRWIDQANEEKKRLKRQKLDQTDIKTEIKQLKGYLKTWKELRLPAKARARV